METHRRPKILFADADASFLQQMGTYLSWCGFEIAPVPDTESVCERVEREPFELVISDLWTGPGDGFLLVESLRKSQSERARRIQILLIAPDVLDERGYHFLREWDVGFMTKYQETEKWLDKIAALLAQGRRG